VIEKKIITLLKGNSEISIAGISGQVGVSKRSVQRKLKVLMADGLIDRISNKTGRGNISVYEIKGDIKGDKRVTQEEKEWVTRVSSFCSNYKVPIDTEYLSSKQVSLLEEEFKDLNIEAVVEEFCSYWSQQKQPKTFVPYLRLRTWFRKSKEYAKTDIRRVGKTTQGRRLSDSKGNKFRDSNLTELARRSQNIR
jgi:predicted transcriptional regulator